MTRSEEILETVWSDPRAALDDASEYLDTLGDADDVERAATLRAMSLAARLVNRLEDSIDYARSGADVAADAGSAELRSLNLLTLAGSLAIAGRTEEGLALIEDSLAFTDDDHMRAMFQFQRGFILNGSGDVLEAKEAFETALEVFREMGDVWSTGSALHNLGQINTQIGRLSEAEKTLEEAMAISQELGETTAIPGLEHNLGLLAAYRGDIPTALERLTRGDELYMEVSGATVPQHVARCEVLISAGLFSEALDLAKQIAAGNQEVGDAEHEARALQVAAQAALLAGEPAEATSLAALAEERYVEQARPFRAMEASAVLCEARYAVEGASSELANRVAELTSRFDQENLVVPAAQSRLLRGRIALDLDETDTALEALQAVADITAGPPELEVQARLARALLRLVAGDTRGADAAVRSGLRLLDDHQAILGATDLRMGIERQGRELGEIGLSLAVDSGRPKRILRWMDRTRARALRYRPVNPGRDDEMSSLMANLRRVGADLRAPDNRADPALLAERDSLQEQITKVDRTRRGEDVTGPTFSMEALFDSLQEKALIEFADHDGRLLAVTIREGETHLHDLGAIDPVLTELSHLRFAMRRSARLGRGLDTSALGRFGEMLLDGIDIGHDLETVIVPPSSLMTVPWSGLPGLQGRAVTISPSAEMWWRSRERTMAGDGVVVAGGPDLTTAESEVTAVGSLYDGAVILPPGSTVEEVRRAIDGASIAHIACHASFQAENPMFSSLRLGDGDLSVYDIERLGSPPSIVVLSACDSGYSEARAGDELAGLTSALLSMGTRSVIASVGLVPDSPATSELMLRLHRGLAAGKKPSRALSIARDGSLEDPSGVVSAASFVCVGA